MQLKCPNCGAKEFEAFLGREKPWEWESKVRMFNLECTQCHAIIDIKTYLELEVCVASQNPKDT